MRLRILFAVIFYLLITKISYSQNLVAQNNTFVMLTIGAPDSVPRHLMRQCFLINEGDSISVQTDSLRHFLSSIYQQSKRVPACFPLSLHSVYFQLWGTSELIYQASNEFQWEFDRKMDECLAEMHFTLNDGTPITAEYLDISAIYYVDEEEHVCSIEFSIPKEENIKEAWSIVTVVACKKSQQVPILMGTK